MLTILILLVVVYAFLWLTHFFILKYRFQFKEDDVTMVFGLPGSGKTTLCADIARQMYLNKRECNTAVLCNFPLHHTFKVTRNDIGKFDVRGTDYDKALILIDEGSVIYNKRLWKDSFLQEENSFHSMHRHYKTQEVVFAQSWDGVDSRMRELTSNLLYVSKARIRPFIKVRRIAKDFDIIDKVPLDGYTFEKWSTRYVFAPRAWKLFDTYDAPPLPPLKLHGWYKD